MKVRLVLAAAAVLLTTVISTAPASAQYTGYGYGGGAPPVAGAVVNPSEPVRAAAVPAELQVGRATPGGVLVLTGADIAQLVVIGGGFLVGGALLVRRGRARVSRG